VTETLAACLTPPGTGAIATLALRGPSAWEIVRGIFRPHSRGGGLPDTPAVGRVWLGRLGADLADEVVLAVRANEPVPRVEMHCHGGQEVVRLLLEALAGCGARVGSWQEFERRTANDPLRAVAAAALADASTARAAAILLDQYHGSFRIAVTAALDALGRGSPSEANQALARLARYAALGRHLTRPWAVAVVGAPNVGKSSLLNALAGYQRSIVSPVPGTTRDVVTATVALDGWPVELTDTAGLREAPGALEGQGIERARGAAMSADLCLWVLDAAAEPVWPDLSSERVLLVVNKVDLPPAWELSRAAGAVHVSSRTGAGIPELCDTIARRLAPHAPAPGQAVPFTPALCDRIEEAHSHAAAGRWDDVRRVLGRCLSI
jgi:tRNA modification GTPase